MFKFVKKSADRIIAKEVERRKNETNESIRKEEDALRGEYALKVKELESVKESVNFQINELKRIREKSEVEQKQLWDRLDILRDNLNTDQVWIKLWECAYSKAVDVVWSIFKKETLHLVEIAKEDSSEKAEKIFEAKYEKRIGEMIISNTDKINTPLFFKQKCESEEKYLLSQKARDREKESYYKGQLDFIKAVTNENIS